MPISHKFQLVILLFVLGCTAGCDQGTKHVARRELGVLGSITLPLRLGEFRLAENPGSFLGLGDSLPERLRLPLFTIGVGLGLAGLLVYLVMGRRHNLPAFIGLALVWAGGTSNWIDRLTRHGHVCDFIYLQIGPFHTGIFNVADFVIVVGSALFVCGFWVQRHKHKATLLSSK